MRIKWLTTQERPQPGSCYCSAQVSRHPLSAFHSSVMGRCSVAPGDASGPDVGTDNTYGR